MRVVNGERWSEAQRSAAMEDFKICEFGTLRITVMFFLVGLLTLLYSTPYSLVSINDLVIFISIFEWAASIIFGSIGL